MSALVHFTPSADVYAPRLPAVMNSFPVHATLCSDSSSTPRVRFSHFTPSLLDSRSPLSPTITNTPLPKAMSFGDTFPGTIVLVHFTPSMLVETAPLSGSLLLGRPTATKRPLPNSTRRQLASRSGMGDDHSLPFLDVIAR